MDTADFHCFVFFFYLIWEIWHWNEKELFKDRTTWRTQAHTHLCSLPNRADFVGTTWDFWEALLGHSGVLEMLLFTAKPHALLSFPFPCQGCISTRPPWWICLCNYLQIPEGFQERRLVYLADYWQVWHTTGIRSFAASKNSFVSLLLHEPVFLPYPPTPFSLWRCKNPFTCLSVHVAENPLPLTQTLKERLHRPWLLLTCQ